MKILRVITSMDPSKGGPCQGIRNSIPALAELDVETHVVCLDDPQSSFLGIDSFPIFAIGPAIGPWAKNEELEKWLLQNACHYDIIVVHGIWQYHVYAVRKMLNQLKKTNTTLPEFYIMPHGMLDPYFQKAQSRKLKSIRNYIYWHLIESKSIRQADGILFTCEEELLLARTTFSRYKPKKELNVSYGIPSVSQYSDKMKAAFLELSHLSSDEKYFLFLSRIHPKKGVDILINVYVDLIKSAKYPMDEMPSLVVAGPGVETNYGRDLLQIVRENKLEKKIIFPGMLSNDSKWGAFYGAEAFVLCSHQENFGISVVEALACSKPVIISNQINIWREIESEKAGIVCNDNYEDLHISFLKWFELSLTQKEDMGTNAFKAYLKYFHVTAAVTKFLKELKKI
jgi:glycosyltransferase involved in cell wall biosynthesis